MNYKIEYAWCCHGGKVRPNNEDNFWCMGEMLPQEHEGSDQIFAGECPLDAVPVFGVFDGMGGESCGEVASYLGARSFGELWKENPSLAKEDPEGFLRLACTKMTDEVLTYERENQIGSMGSTVAIAALGKEHLAVANLGDSRIYASYSGKMAQISKDHVLGRSFFGKAPLTQYLGLPTDEMLLEPSVQRMPYRVGLCVLLCSDGLSDMVSERRIRELMEGRDARQTVEGLLSEALAEGGRDNVTAVVIRILGGEEGVARGEAKPQGLFSRIFGNRSRLWG